MLAVAILGRRSATGHRVVQVLPITAALVVSFPLPLANYLGGLLSFFLGGGDGMTDSLVATAVSIIRVSAASMVDIGAEGADGTARLDDRECFASVISPTLEALSPAWKRCKHESSDRYSILGAPGGPRNPPSPLCGGEFWVRAAVVEEARAMGFKAAEDEPVAAAAAAAQLCCNAPSNNPWTADRLCGAVQYTTGSM